MITLVGSTKANRHHGTSGGFAAVETEKRASLANIIAISEIILTAKEFIKSGSLWPLLYTAVFYLTFTAIITLLLQYAEKKMSYYR